MLPADKRAASGQREVAEQPRYQLSARWGCWAKPTPAAVTLRLTHLFGISDPTAIRYCAELGPATRQPAYRLAGEQR